MKQLSSLLLLGLLRVSVVSPVLANDSPPVTSDVADESLVDACASVNETADLAAGRHSSNAVQDNEDTFDDDESSYVYKVWEETDYTLDDFVVGGVNLATFGRQPLFPLYADFDISHLIVGDEDWAGLLAHRNGLTRPSLSFYVDKVARKRWLPTRGYPQPVIHLLAYADELLTVVATHNVDDEAHAIHEALPATGSYAAKPTHMSLTKGTWLVDQHGDGTTFFSLHGRSLVEGGGNEEGGGSITFDARHCARSLAQSLHEKCDEIESWALKNVQPGLVVEERWSSHEAAASPPHEFNMFTIWGRVWVGQWNAVYDQNRYCDGFIYRNGTVAARGHRAGQDLPDWIPWERLVQIAEELGANKDMFRTDIFVGRPSDCKDLSAPLEIAVSESEIFPTTEFTNDELSGEAARLWIAGYVLGIYELVDNTEVPVEFLERGRLSSRDSYV
jgi:hypothetical protein